MIELSNDKSFIEVQFPVSKVSKESYKERKAGSNQTLTGLGKWWGRKPLILVRSIILGLLMPASDNPKKDREIFLKILSMDEAGLLNRKNQTIPIADIYKNLTPTEQKRFFSEDKGKIVYKRGISKSEKQDLQKTVFKRLSYDEKLKYCCRPEELENIDSLSWQEINGYLGTEANTIQELIVQLSKKRFGHNVKVGDCFSGGGSIPFEAARIGCDVYGSDLNPIAALLTWSGLNIINKSEEEFIKLLEFLEDVFDEATKQIDAWKIETNEYGWKAKYYLYCNETTCPECGCKVPLSPSWVINDPDKVIAILKYNEIKNNFDIDIKTGVSKAEIINAKNNATIQDNNLYCPKCKNRTPISAIRKDRRTNDGKLKYGLREWDSTDFVPLKEDIFQERLYCIKYFEKFNDKTWDEVIKKPASATDACYGNAYYCAPTESDLAREEKVIKLLEERFLSWREKGYIPDSRIEEGSETTRLIRERGWSHWHQLFNPRQLLMHGLLMEIANQKANNQEERVISLLGINSCANWNSKLCYWLSSRKGGGGASTFVNQALNTMFTYTTRTILSLYLSWTLDIKNYEFNSNSTIELIDSRCIEQNCDLWITDPPYADAVNYHELSEFFLAWDKSLISKIFNKWYSDSRRVLAVKGTGETFNNSMVEIYKNLANHTNDDGMQVVMFTHQDVSVWADLTMILWSAGLQVTAAWNIATETESGGLKEGNYVKGTVLLILRKQTSDVTAYLDELYPEIEEEVKRQIDSMRELDDKEDPNFSDADYLLAAYAASLEVLTSYKQIEDIDIKYELSKTRVPGEESPIEKIIKEAVKIAYDYLIPSGFDQFTWKLLIPEERFYIKGLDLEKDGVYQVGAYQELARGFGVREYKDLLASTKANQARLKTALEFGMRGMGDSDRFGSSVLRNVLAALHQSIKEEDTSKGRNWLKNELPNYWQQRNTIIDILDYIATLGNIENMSHWQQEANYAKLLRELIKNDGV